jgi:methylated-DNA-[protein]-cysteine S-methyltransferase
MIATHTVRTTRLGEVTFVTDGDHLTGCYLGQQKTLPTDERLGPRSDRHPVLAEAHRQLTEYLDGARTGFDVPLAPSGGEFEQSVWRRLRDIPYGTTVSYGELARELGGVGLAQRVGQAVGRNPLLVFIPCHRVVGADGALVGFAAGLPAKRTLLDLEEPVGARLF